MRAALAFFALFSALLFPATAGAAPIAVTVSIPPQKYFVEQIGGSDVTVTVMAAKGQDPHSYEPTAAQMESIARAEMYCTIGVPFETQWVPKFRSLNPSMRVVDLLGAIPRIEGKPDLALRDTLPGKGRNRHDEHDHDHDAHGGHHHGLDTDDPHAWLSPDDMAKAVPVIVAALAEKRPDRAAAFAERGAALDKNLADLSARIRAMLAGAKTRTFLTFHQSWAHYARNFGLREASVELEGREPGPKSMAMLMDFAKANNIKVIVADSMTGRSAVEAIANNIGASVIHATPLAEDWPGALLEFSGKLAAALGAPQ
ncbi:putative Periplasmic solute binding protein [uncultured delta proteobacterium]|uniref:Putative Periplasmic solute binding protein n=1 Tax=uncultured delta proteobacterium TaxID=34034 RepID=A0A212IWB7_9DELT|nr:putative Periplasmic solute binding protein [uncultured delta proteobacterium]